MTDEQLSFTAHLVELRKRLIISVGVWLVCFFASYSQAERIFQFIVEPVRKALPKGSSLVFITPIEPFFTYMKIAALTGFVIALPIILWQAWSFIAPGLYAKEKRFAIPFVLTSCLCFAAGTFFGFTYVYPKVFTFLIWFGTNTGDINAMLSMGAYLSLSIKLLSAFGVIFELPIVIFFLARMGVVDYKWLSKHRKYALLVAFIVGALLTPPDVFSQCAVAFPFIALYEVGIIVARLFGKKKPDLAPEAEPSEPAK
jgi:sec-independent protein translocase protein TatC